MEPWKSVRQAPTQVPTPRGSTRAWGANTGQSPNSSDDRRKSLLDQLISGFEPALHFLDPPTQDTSDPPTALPYSAPTPDSTSSPPQPQEYRPRPEIDQHYLPQIYKLIPNLAPQPAGSQRLRQRVEFPARIALSESPIPSHDALLASTFGPSPTQSQVKSKPIQVISPASRSDQAWSGPKRRSVEDLLDKLTRRESPFPRTTQAVPESQIAPYPAYLGGEAYRPNQLQQSGGPSLAPRRGVTSSLPPAPEPPTFQQAPPRQNPLRNTDSPLDEHTTGRHGEMEILPTPHGGNLDGQEGGRRNEQKSPHTQAQSIVFDVTSPLDEVQAPRDSIKSTPVSAMKSDPNFSPGTTVGTTRWLAYALPGGGIRVIRRSSGDHTLLQLPQPFAPSASVIDMAVFGSRLAGVTSDGGFMAWELPEDFVADAPGRPLLQVLPSTGPSAIRSVKWHPMDPETLAVASDTCIYLIDIVSASKMFITVHPADLYKASQVFTSDLPIVAFDFDVLHFALATISDDSTMTLWSVTDSVPFWSHKIKGEDLPSSLNLVDGGAVVGRKNGTIFQLLSYKGKCVISTIKFINSNCQEDPGMFGHIAYDHRIQTLWVANSRRDSVIALRIGSNGLVPSPMGEGGAKGPFIQQVIEFGGPNPTICFDILNPYSDPTGEEALRACEVAKVSQGELALFAIFLHENGVDEVLILREWFDTASLGTPAKFPSYVQSPQSILQQRQQQQQQPVEQAVVEETDNPMTAPNSAVLDGLNEPAWKRVASRASPPHDVISLIEAILTSENEVKMIGNLCGDNAQSVIDVMHETLDHPDLPPRLRKKCLRILCRICGRRALLPKSLQIPLSYNRLDTPLYRGGYADVWKGEHQGSHVAVKVLRVYSTTDFDKVAARFCKEVVTWNALHHPNVLQLLGVTMADSQFAMVSEWMENGNINEFVKAHRDANRFELLKDVARGLIYMHGQAMIHGDLKGANILIDQGGHARLADFGLLTIVSDPTNFTASSSLASGGTTRWMSPELLHPDEFGLEDSRPTKESDCYALGMVIYEVLSGQVPFTPLKDFIVMRKVTNGERPARPEGAKGVLFSDELWWKVNLCWATQPASRPSIAAVLEYLDQISGTWKPPPPQVGGGVAEMDEDEWHFTLTN